MIQRTYCIYLFLVKIGLCLPALYVGQPAKKHKDWHLFPTLVTLLVARSLWRPTYLSLISSISSYILWPPDSGLRKSLTLNGLPSGSLYDTVKQSYTGEHTFWLPQLISSWLGQCLFIPNQWIQKRQRRRRSWNYVGGSVMLHINWP